MSELQAYYNNCCSSYWADPDRESCGCRGGWFLSEVDTWHKCPYHDHDAPHPEYADEPADSEEHDADDPVPVLRSWTVNGVTWEEVEREALLVHRMRYEEVIIRRVADRWTLSWAFNSDLEYIGGYFQTANAAAKAYADPVLRKALLARAEGEYELAIENLDLERRGLL